MHLSDAFPLVAERTYDDVIVETGHHCTTNDNPPTSLLMSSEKPTGGPSPVVSSSIFYSSINNTEINNLQIGIDNVMNMNHTDESASNDQGTLRRCNATVVIVNMELSNEAEECLQQVEEYIVTNKCKEIPKLKKYLEDKCPGASYLGQRPGCIEFVFEVESREAVCYIKDVVDSGIMKELLERFMEENSEIKSLTAGKDISVNLSINEDHLQTILAKFQDKEEDASSDISKDMPFAKEEIQSTNTSNLTEDLWYQDKTITGDGPDKLCFRGYDVHYQSTRRTPLRGKRRTSQSSMRIQSPCSKKIKDCIFEEMKMLRRIKNCGLFVTCEDVDTLVNELEDMTSSDIEVDFDFLRKCSQALDKLSEEERANAEFEIRRECLDIVLHSGNRSQHYIAVLKREDKGVVNFIQIW
ncbi:uncharacterized protein LOC144445320 [Glandiceps talaboti]